MTTFVVRRFVDQGLLVDLSANLHHPYQVAEVCRREGLADLAATDTPLGPEQATARLGGTGSISTTWSGKHKRHGMNAQVLTDPFGRLLWASPVLPGSTHDLTAARNHGIVDALAGAGLKCWADKAHQGADRLIRVPFRGRRLKRWKRRHNSSHAQIRCVGEQAMAALKGWRLLRKLRCGTNRITDIVKAVLVLHHTSTWGWKRLSLGVRDQKARGRDACRGTVWTGPALGVMTLTHVLGNLSDRLDTTSS
ncbi:hypothetical protein GCM10010363_33810 [Streptomyces omiyaensis]|nr:hypothetical protein GCM10010363_33810 [Streptomyces omiyaensis]